ncbi:MAG: hypothetical protein MZV64_14770 [Ignavibacteriales bacterium]|nr:hypothetical protein [Ignavibacteriales bacterium]
MQVVGRAAGSTPAPRCGWFARAVELAQLDRGGDVVGIELDHPPEDVEQPRQVPGPLVGRGHQLELAHRVAHQAELLVERRQLLVHPEVLRVELARLLVDGHRLQEEALVGVDVRDLLEGLGGRLVVAQLLEELADLEERSGRPSDPRRGSARTS